MLQALELISRNETELFWVKASALREQVAKLLGQPVEKLGDAQWIGHILKRLHLVDEARRRRNVDGIAYAIYPAKITDMMRRYDVKVIVELS